MLNEVNLRSLTDNTCVHSSIRNALPATTAEVIRMTSENDAHYSWVPFYEEFADKLLPYQNNRDKLIKKIVHMYKTLDMKLPKLNDEGLPSDMDPFTAYGLFNKGLSDKNRVKIVGGIANEFGISAARPTSFDGIPVLNNLNATFYRFDNDAQRGVNDVDNIWRLFSAALALDHNDTTPTRNEFTDAYDAVSSQVGIKWNLTMGLYWTRPYRYLSLDRRNRWYLGNQKYAGNEIAKIVPNENDDPITSGQVYLSVCDEVLARLGTDDCPSTNFPELSYAAWKESERVNDENRAAKKAADQQAEEKALGDEGIEDNNNTVASESSGTNQDEESNLTAYGRDDFLDEVYMDAESYDTLVGLLKTKKNVILEGAPGVGKTFTAKRLAYSIMGVKNPERVELIQFHQSYSYEDFIEGYRPTQTGFELQHGAFYDFCKRAADDSDNDYFFIIDEINRGNLSKIFGELFMLLEADKRGEKNRLKLLYSHEWFYVPSNVYLIGMMNTADRSLAMLDYALRRRFAFFKLVPAFDSEGFQSYLASIGSEKLNRLVACVQKLNEDIATDETLGSGFCIGHSYLCNLSMTDDLDVRLSSIVRYELVPLLCEYWFDDPDKVQEWSRRLEDALR